MVAAEEKAQDRYTVLEEIGQGSFGSVCKIQRTDGKIFVWKEISYGRMSEREKHQLVSEVNILRDLRHPNIVRFYDRIIDKQKARIYIVMEFCEYGDLANVIKQNKRRGELIPEDTAWKVFSQVVEALEWCHTRPEGVILHRDIKPGNILLDANSQVKLGDFGLARVLKGNDLARTHVGTPYYMSPEQVQGNWYNEKSDIWSLGCLTYELCALRPPFEAASQHALGQKILTGSFARLPGRFSQELQRCLEWMLKSQPSSRPSARDLLGVPQVAVRIRSRKLRDGYSALRRGVTECRKKEELVNAREERLRAWEEDLRARELALEQREAAVGGCAPASPEAKAVETQVDSGAAAAGGRAALASPFSAKAAVETPSTVATEGRGSPETPGSAASPAALEAEGPVPKDLLRSLDEEDARADGGLRPETGPLGLPPYETLGTTPRLREPRRMPTPRLTPAPRTSARPVARVDLSPREFIAPSSTGRSDVSPRDFAAGRSGRPTPRGVPRTRATYAVP